jgi:hypothetical protein
MDKIEFRIEPSPDSNDHQVRILINGQDVIPDRMIGLDPWDDGDISCSLLDQEALSTSGELTYARCSCGVVGCGSDSVEVTRSDETVSWRFPSLDRKSTVFGGSHKAAPFVFDRQQYDQAVADLRNDFKWEPMERTAERLVGQLDFSKAAGCGLLFHWASGRMNQDKFGLCFRLGEPQKYQVIAYMPWNPRTPEGAVEVTKHLLQQPPTQWPDVVYYNQTPHSTQPPELCGPGWRAHI